MAFWRVVLRQPATLLWVVLGLVVVMLALTAALHSHQPAPALDNLPRLVGH